MKLVFKPIAARAAIIRNLLILLRPETSTAGKSPRLVSMDMARNPRMNHGKIEQMRTLTPSAWDFCFFFRCRLMAANDNTAGIMARVLVSLTMVAKSPAASLKAYPVATTLEVSLTAVPAHRPNAASESPSHRPSNGNTTIIMVSKRKVADIP